MKKLTKIAILVSSLAAATAFAAPYYNSQTNNAPVQGIPAYQDGSNGVAPYVGGLVGATNYAFSQTDQWGDNYSTSMSGGIGYEGHVGVMFNQFVGVEGRYVRYGDFNVGKQKQYFVGPAIDVKGVLPLQSGFNIYLKLGFASMTLKASGHSNNNNNYSGFDFGLGGGYYFTPNLEGVIDWSGTSIDGQANSTVTPNMFSAGINFHF